MSKSYDRRNRREALWKEDPRCFWCGIGTILIKRKGNFKCEDNQATLDHLYHRLDPSRQEPNTTKEQRYVLACFKCNKERGAEEQRYQQMIGNPKAFNGESIERRSIEKFNGRLLYQIQEIFPLSIDGDAPVL